MVPWSSPFQGFQVWLPNCGLFKIIKSSNIETRSAITTEKLIAEVLSHYKDNNEEEKDDESWHEKGKNQEEEDGNDNNNNEKSGLNSEKHDNIPIKQFR